MTASSLTSSQLPLLQHIYMTEPHECVWSSYPFISSTGCSDVTYSIIWCVRQIVHFSAASSDRSADGNMLPYCISSDRFTLLPAVPAERGVTLVNHYQFQQTVSVNSGRNATPLFFLLPKYFTDLPLLWSSRTAFFCPFSCKWLRLSQFCQWRTMDIVSVSLFSCLCTCQHKPSIC